MRCDSKLYLPHKLCYYLLEDAHSANMEEADLLKERLQAITDKRRIQENITVKRRQIEEEKLKLQYIKKKALREQWLMDGLSQQSKEEQAALKLQAQDEQQQSDQLKSNILRIEKEIEALETEELSISAKEEVILKRLKEVERTTEDIIKELNADLQADLTNHVIQPHKNVPSFSLLQAEKTLEAGCEEPKKATFAMEISVEHDRRTGRSQVVSTATITPKNMEERGLKVYDDGHKSVYALLTEGGQTPSGAVGEMTSREVKELLHKAVDKDVPTEVQYHLPVYSTPYMGNSRPSTPRTANKTQRLTPLGSLSPVFRGRLLSEENQISQDPEGWKTPSPSLIPQDSTLKHRLSPYVSYREQTRNDSRPNSCAHSDAKSPQGLTKTRTDARSPSPGALVSVTARPEGMPPLIKPVYTAVDNQSALPTRDRSEVDPETFRESPWDSNRYSPFNAEITPSLNLISTFPEEQDSQSITMIFMGYENAEEEEDEDIQAELVIIGNSDEDDDEDFNESQLTRNKSQGEECLSYHPEGCRSKVFKPTAGMGKVPDCRDMTEDAHTPQLDSRLHKPTFIHKPGKHSPYLQGPGGSANTGSINLEKMKLCSTGR